MCYSNGILLQLPGHDFFQFDAPLLGCMMEAKYQQQRLYDKGASFCYFFKKIFLLLFQLGCTVTCNSL